jgi:transcriptional regulator with GAF, ATPase, and Fis domain
MIRDHSGESLEALAVAARRLQAAATADDLLRQIVDMAVVSVEGCRYAGVSTYQDGRLSSPVVSDPAVLEIDALQYQIDVGPCLAAMRGPDVLVDAPDLEHDPRFAPFGRQAAEHGCRAVLAHRLYVDADTLGSLNLYATNPHAYSDGDRQRSTVLAALASLAVNVVRLEVDGEGLRQAVRSRDVIGQAKGILMARHEVSADEAFVMLRQRSNDENLKLRDVAEQLVDEATAGERP